jgi:Glycosyl hydrolase family 47
MNVVQSGIGMLIPDAIDTLWVTGRQADFARSKEWIVEKLRSRVDRLSTSVSVFELIIRAVGGVLSAHDLSGDPELVTVAQHIVDKYVTSGSHQKLYPFIPLGTQTTASIQHNNADTVW